MAFLHNLTAPGPLEASAAFALGFLLIAAWLGGELAFRVRLPRVIGYLIAGFCMGPAWLHLVRADEIAALRFISDAAITLIALSAGSALDVKTLGFGRASFARFAGAAIGFPFVAIALVLLSVSPWFPLTRHLSFGTALAIALVLAAFATIASPTLTMAIMDEEDARGPFARAVLSLASAQAVVAAVVLSLVLVIALPFASPGALNVRVAWVTLGRLAGSLATGIVLGALVARYQKLARRNGALLLVAAGFLGATAARVLHVEPVLVGLAGGWYLTNVFPGGGGLLARAQHTLPAYVTWFVLTGADVEIDALADLWPWIALLVGLRAVALRYGLQWAGRQAQAVSTLATDGWLGLISQAGVGLGLATMVRRALPASGVSLEALIVAIIAVHEVVGPICFRRALARVGELKEEEHVVEGTIAHGTLVGIAGGGLRG
jgi:Kef-type K+ transport system membrane component KefB